MKCKTLWALNVHGKSIEPDRLNPKLIKHIGINREELSLFHSNRVLEDENWPNANNELFIPEFGIVLDN